MSSALGRARWQPHLVGWRLARMRRARSKPPARLRCFPPPKLARWGWILRNEFCGSVAARCAPASSFRTINTYVTIFFDFLADSLSLRFETPPHPNGNGKVREEDEAHPPDQRSAQAARALFTCRPIARANTQMRVSARSRRSANDGTATDCESPNFSQI